MEQKYFSKKETAIMLGVHPRTVERYLLAGMLNGARLGKEWKISQGDIEAFYENAKAETKKFLHERQTGADTNSKVGKKGFGTTHPHTNHTDANDTSTNSAAKTSVPTKER